MLQIYVALLKVQKKRNISSRPIVLGKKEEIGWINELTIENEICKSIIIHHLPCLTLTDHYWIIEGKQIK